MAEITGVTLTSIPFPPELQPWRVIALVDHQFVYADHRLVSHAYGIVGILKPGAADQVAGSAWFCRKGMMCNPAWAWATDVLFLGQNGMLTEVVPETGFVLPVATVFLPDQIHVSFGEAMLYG
jgi:hypothetical protein